MLLRILMSEGEMSEKILTLLIAIIALLPALTVHEWAHGFSAYKLGDHTAKIDGRLSLNPLDHLDPIGSLMLLLFGFGWAKPVPVMTRNFKNPKRDFAISAFAGPFANFVLGFISSLFLVLSVFVPLKLGLTGITFEVLQNICYFSLIYNIGLGLFNLIPIPPLDGSNILMCLLPNHLAAKYAKVRYYTRYIILGLLLCSWLPYPLSTITDIVFLPLDFLRSFLTNGFITVWELLLQPLFF